MTPEPKLYTLQHSHLVSAIRILVDNDEHLMEFLFSHKEPRLRTDTGALMSEARGYSSGQRLVIRTAIDFWNGTGVTPLNRLLDVWDDANWIRFMHAVTYLRECREELMAVLSKETCV